MERIRLAEEARLVEEEARTDSRIDEGIRTMLNEIDEKTRHAENARHTKEACPIENGHTTKETCHVQKAVHAKNPPEIYDKDDCIW